MVMKVHTGVPGAGKSFLLVKSFCDLFCNYDNQAGKWEFKPEKKNITLISNIEGLALDHLDLETLMQDRCLQLARVKFLADFKSGHKSMDDLADVVDEYYKDFHEEKVRWFFEMGYQKHLAARFGGPVVYLIEECQRYFDSKELGRQNWVRDVLFFFEKHRHLGFSLLMDTQHISKIHKGIAVLFEEEIRAKPRTMSVVGEFRYNSYVDGLKINQVPIVARPDKRIFAAYKSMAAAEDVKTKKPLAKLMAFVVVVAVAAYCILNYAKSNLGPGDAIAAKKNVNAAPGAEKIVGESVAARLPGDWVHLPHVMDSAGAVLVVHPIYNSIVPLTDFDLDVKVTGTSLFAFVPAKGVD